MQSFQITSGDTHILRIDPGEDVLTCVRALLAEKGVEQGIIVGGYGTLASYHIHWVTRNTLPSKNAFGKGEGGIEILSMNGLIIKGEPHIHVTLSNPDGAFGGHLEEGCRAYVLCEVFVQELHGPKLTRVPTDVDIAEMGQGTVQRLMPE